MRLNSQECQSVPKVYIDHRLVSQFRTFAIPKIPPLTHMPPTVSGEMNYSQCTHSGGTTRQYWHPSSSHRGQYTPPLSSQIQVHINVTPQPSPTQSRAASTIPSSGYPSSSVPNATQAAFTRERIEDWNSAIRRSIPVESSQRSHRNTSPTRNSCKSEYSTPPAGRIENPYPSQTASPFSNHTAQTPMSSGLAPPQHAKISISSVSVLPWNGMSWTDDPRYLRSERTSHNFLGVTPSDLPR